MPDSNKSTIVIASVLKPVDDSRLYEKIGLSLASTGKYYLHIIGCESAKVEKANIRQHAFMAFGRVSLGRFLAPWRIFFKTLKLKPDIFIVATHELLYTAVFVKLLIRCRLIYDVQENYYWNILYTPAFPLVIKPFVALYVRGKETLTARYIDHFFLAEKGYEREMKFPTGKSTVLENKVRVAETERKTTADIRLNTTINLIFSGTLAETTGIFTAIDLAVKLHVIDERFRLTIIGCCAQSRVLEKIRMLIQPRPFIQLIARDSPVPHADIFKYIRKADFGLITYEINPSTMNSIPTKLYEYLGFRLPILLVNHKPWVDFCLSYSAAVVFDVHHFDAAAIYNELLETTFYTAEPATVYWETEEPRLLEGVERVLRVS
jgi:hypothetical protein